MLIFRREFGKTNLTSLVERQSRYTLLMKNQDRQSTPLMEQIIGVLAPLPAGARQSFTFDRGTEFTAWRRLKDGLGAETWFCDPSAPWQKGSVENTNRRLRRYLLRSTDLVSIRERRLREICHQLNNTPRKCLDYRTPLDHLRPRHGVYRLALSPGWDRSSDLVLRSAIALAEGHRREHERPSQEVALARCRSPLPHRPGPEGHLRALEHRAAKVPGLQDAGRSVPAEASRPDAGRRIGSHSRKARFSENSYHEDHGAAPPGPGASAPQGPSSCSYGRSPARP